MNERSGYFKSNLTGELLYKSFYPMPLPPEPPISMDDEMIALLSNANRSLGILEGVSNHVSNIDLFVSMYVRKEALLSSQIEGTQATLDDILDPNLDSNINQNISEVINYIKGNYSVAAMSNRIASPL